MLCLAWIVLCLFNPAFAQTASNEAEPPTEEAVDSQDATEGILPVPDYSGDFWTRPNLTGDWGGIRQDWADNGFTFDLRWFQAGQGIVSGGRDERWAYVTNLDYFLNFDLMRMGILPGAVIAFRGQSRFGETVNENSGQLLPVNTYSLTPFSDPSDDDVPFTITELNWTQFLSNEVGLVLGKITTLKNTNEFAGGEGRSQFMNFQFLFSAVFANVAPYSTLAAGGLWIPSPHVNVSTIFMNTTDSSTTSGFDDIGDGTTWATSVNTQYRLGDLPGGTSVTGVYAFDGEFGEIGGFNIDPELGLSLDTKDTSWAVYANGWQYLFVEGDAPATIDPGDGRQDAQGLGLFALVGTADQDTNPVTFSVAGGVGGRGTFDGRDDDTWGVGYFYNDLQEPGDIVARRLTDSTQGFEAYYNIAVARSIALTVDFQAVRSAVKDVDDAYILGLRLDAAF
jgi:porin